MTAPQIATRLTARFGLTTPLVLAPMALAAGGALAAAWARAGALGLLGGGYGDLGWVQRETAIAEAALAGDAAARARYGAGFISWKLAEDRAAFDWLLDQPVPPAAVMLSFGAPGALAARLNARGIAVLVQIQRAEQLAAALDAGATAVVAQGAEAGGHGMKAALGRSSFTLIPELADRLAAQSPETLLIAAGGIADGRGLAAALLLGADGALIGSRAWATQESLASPAARAAARAADGDATMRSSVFDILRGKNWPQPYDFRALRNDLHREWEGREAELAADPAPARARYDAAVAAGDFRGAHVTVGEAVALIDDDPTSAALIARITADAAARLKSATSWLG